MSSEGADWSRPFDDPNTLPDGRVPNTFHDAGHDATALPKAVQERVEWQTATEMLIWWRMVIGRLCSLTLPCGGRCTHTRQSRSQRRVASGKKKYRIVR